MIDKLVERAQDAFADSGEVDLVNGLAAAFPARMTAQLVGFPQDEWRSVKRWSECIMRLDGADDPAIEAEFVGAVLEFAPRLPAMCEARQAEPRDDLLTRWADAGIDDEVLINETGLFISGGAETTRTVIARGLLEFTKHPDQWEAIHRDPTLLPGAVDELIRWVTPLNNFFRTVTRDDTIGGVAVAEGDRVILLYPSANRDERVFDAPYSFDITRKHNNHVAFGFGTHFCLGASLARQALGVLLRHLTHRITDLHVIEAPEIEANIFVGAVKSARLGFTSR